MKKRSVAIVGTGPAALMAGTILVENGFNVQFFDHKKAPARKFLVAGHGGFNLTNAEDLASFCEKYDSELVRNAVRFFTPQNFVTFLEKIGIETYVGSSGKVFPRKGMKPIEVLNSWLNYLKVKGAVVHLEHTLVDFELSELIFQTNKNRLTIRFDAVFFALGGGSWQQTGSTGNWQELFKRKNVQCLPFESSNSGLVLDTIFLSEKLEGSCIKNCRLFSKEFSKLGDVVLTNYGIEGAPAYAMNRDFRNGNAVFIDFKPSLSSLEIEIRLLKAKTMSDGLKQLKLSKIAIQCIKISVSKQ
jgi:predicted Rossmann fold flavoprotein